MDSKFTEITANPSEMLRDVMDKCESWRKSIGITCADDLNNFIIAGKWKELILIQESYLEKYIGDLAKQIASDERRKFIMIAGPSSSGKTSFSHRLSIQLMARGLKPHAIALDDFFKNREHTPVDENGEYDFECLEALDVRLFNKVMNQLLAGEEVYLPSFNFKTGHREKSIVPTSLGPGGVLVIEGIHGLNEKLSEKIPSENIYRIFISVFTQLGTGKSTKIPPSDARLVRRIVRDARSRGATAEQTLMRWPSVRRGEEKNILPFRDKADVMFNSSYIYETAMLRVYAVPLLCSVPKDSPVYDEAKRLLKFLDHFLPMPAEPIANNSILREFIGGSIFNV